MAAADQDKNTVRSWLAVVRAYHLCAAVMSQRLAVLGVPMAEHEILANLLREPGISQQTLAARCFSAKSHVSTLLAGMEERELVRREADPADARAKRLSLTRKGEALARKTQKVQAEIVQAMSEALTPAEMAQVEDAMARVSERLERLGSSP